MDITCASGRINGVNENDNRTKSPQRYLNDQIMMFYPNNLRTSCLNWKMLNGFELLDLREQPANGLHGLIE